MAVLEVLDNICGHDGCVARATRRVKSANGTTVGDYCTRHAQSVLIDTTARDAGKEPPKRRNRAAEASA